MSQNTEMPPSPVSTITCSNCHSAMPSELRFCRNCGFRLGLGYGDQGQQLAQSTSAPLAVPKKRRRRSGMTWVFIGLLVFFVGAAAFIAIVDPFRINVYLVTRPLARA